MSILRNRVLQETKALDPGLVASFMETLDRILVVNGDPNRFQPTGKTGADGNLPATRKEDGQAVLLRYLELPGFPGEYPDEDEATDPAMNEATDPGERTDPASSVRRVLKAEWSDVWELLYESSLQHARIPAVFEVEEQNDAVLFVRPAVGAKSLGEWAQTVDLKARMRAFESLCGVVAAAHGKNVLHRALSPMVVRMDEPDALWVRGWRSPIGKVVGSGGWLSPEQVWGEGENPRSDIYSLGLILRMLVTGEVPANLPASDLKPSKKKPVPLADSMPAPLKNLCAECLSVDPAARPADARLLFARFLGISRKIV